MGQEISVSHFKYHDFHRFERLIDREMRILHDWFEQGLFAAERPVGGMELETWIVDQNGEPLPINAELLERIDSPDVVPELSRFNIEFNVDPQPLAGRGIEMLTQELDRTWQQCRRAAAGMNASVLAIGTLPTLTDRHLTLRNMSQSLRFHALNEQTLRLRQGAPIRLEIEGRERLSARHFDVMLEAGTTSFQLHLQVPLAQSVRFYNASLIVAAPLAAISANSPLLFGNVLWDETRIPLFEQAVDIGAGRYRRVTFGSDYAEGSLEGLFVENRAEYPVMLPLAMEDESMRLAHLRLHNGTVWRWVRPLIGFDSQERPHLRIEQRVPAAGPTTIDMAANMAFYYGLAEALATAPRAPESRLWFHRARENFYLAARHGLDAELMWLDLRQRPVRALIREHLIPLAAQGLATLGVADDLAANLLAIIDARAASGQNGAKWQRRFVERHGRDLARLTCDYRDRQQDGSPVHTWTV